jgi:hypothetical protein
MKRAFVLIVLLNLCTDVGFAQEKCGTITYQELTTIMGTPENNQRVIDSLRETSTLLNSTSTTDYFIVPIIVHVVYNSPEQNLSDEMIRRQVRILNEDFRNLSQRESGFPVNTISADTRIVFHLAGIVRVQTNESFFISTNDRVKSASTGGSNPFDTRYYLNMWICRLRDNLLGYATIPTQPGTQGAVVDYRTVAVQSGYLGSGTSFFGRTATHEIGHYFNLFHIWGDRGCSSSDFVDDTPQCSGFEPDSRFPSCSAPIECGNRRQIENYMDYSDDGCMSVFTAGQSSRMRDAIVNYRSSVVATSSGFLRPPLASVVSGRANFTSFRRDYSFTLLAEVSSISSGEYIADTYEFSADIPLSDAANASLWIQNGQAMNFGDPNNGQPALFKEQLGSFVRFKTAFHFIKRDGNGRAINRWLPYNPYSYINPRTGEFEYVLNVPPTLALQNINETSSIVRLASNSITTAGDGSFYTVSNGASATLRAGNEVRLLPGTSLSSSGGTFRAYIDPSLTTQAAPDNLLASVAPEPTVAAIASETRKENLPTAFALEQNYPNPFNPSTVIRYSLKDPAKATLKIYDMLGRTVATLVDEPKSAGSYEARFNAASLSSGVYFYRLQAGSFVETKKMFLVK